VEADRDVFCDLFGLTVSAAGLCRAFQRVANRGQPLYDNLRAQMHVEPVVSLDETSWRVNGEGAWLHTAAAPRMTLYSIARGRGFEEAAHLIGEDYEGILAVDGWSPYRRFSATIQTCLAHLLRRSHELQNTPRPETFSTVARSREHCAQARVGAARPADGVERARVRDCSRPDRSRT
jgi:hypothetical protein